MFGAAELTYENGCPTRQAEAWIHQRNKPDAVPGW
jgi:hypothetical protein